MGIMNWFKKKDKVEATFEEAEQELQSYSGQETVSQANPFQVIKEESGCGSGGCGSETKTTNSGGCCSTESPSVLMHVTTQTTLREAGQNPIALEIMLKSGLPFGCGMKHLSIQEAGKSSGLGAPKIKKIVDEINEKIGNKDGKQSKSVAPLEGGKISGKKTKERPVKAPGKKGGKTKK
ncbi:MAG TPA: hypothetical protein VJG90_06900 [Candidatus Nanoarchaeia archaeon]|nr:hypothetical protein [Candidatus Nanoarchaeia archaeon]